MSNAKYKYLVQLWGCNSPWGEPHWMTVAWMSTMEKAEAEKRFLLRHRGDDGSVRIIKKKI